MKKFGALVGTLALGFMVTHSVQAGVMDISDWETDGTAYWELASDNKSVTQKYSTQSTMYFDDANSQGTKWSVTAGVNTFSDDDFFGFVLGYNDGDLLNENADYLLIDWKQSSQWAFGSRSFGGLAISRVTGQLDPVESWLHRGSVEELQRGVTLGSTGWDDLVKYDFDIHFAADQVDVFVNDVLELSVSGQFADGGFGFYANSQYEVEFGDVTQSSIKVAEVPEPSSLALIAFGLIGLSMAGRKRRATHTRSV